MDSSTEVPDGRDTARIEAFSDGVFAIAATLLVLELHVPDGDDAAGGLGAFLQRQWPSYVAYLASFLVIGVIWINHHAVIRLVRRADHGLLVLNLLLLLTVSVIPFPTALIAGYATGHHTVADRRIAVVVYGIAMTLMSVAFNALWRWVRAHPAASPSEDDQRAIRRRHLRFNVGLALYPVLTLVGLLDVRVFLAGLLVLAGLYLLPTRARPVRRPTGSVPATGPTAGPRCRGRARTAPLR